MYEKIPDGKIIDIQGLECCLPPEGYVFNILTKKIEYRGIYKRSEVKAEQFWKRFEFPFWYKEVLKEWDSYDKSKKDEDPDFYNEKLEEYKKQEWDRRLNGFWFYNYGVPVYITGLYYFYLQWWSIDIGYPKFRIPDLEKFYFMQYCIEDPKCLGGLEVTKRRFGKSFVAGCFVTEYPSRTKMANGGIQSKTGSDAKKFFSKTVVNPFRRLPKFFRPEYDESLGVNPKSELRFQKTNVRGKNANKNVDKDELGSLIDWATSDKVAYDGQKLHRYVGDEEAKTVEVDVYDRHEVVRYCLKDDEGNIIGKAWYTTTVEKLDSDKNGVQDAFKLLWKESDQLNKGENGETRSGLYRFFMSAKRTRYFDEYGYPDEEKTLKAILADRETVKNNSRSLNARTRKEPLTIEEAFLDDADTCVFNVNNITSRMKELNMNPITKRKIKFYRDEEQKIRWRDIQDSEKDFCWEVTWMPPKEKCNLFTFDGVLRKPNNTQDGAITIDSYSNSQGGRKYGSKAAAWIGRRFDINDPHNTGRAVGFLYGRPEVKDSLHEQVMMASEYYGYQAWYEHTADDYEGYFRERGKIGYLGLYPMSLIDPTKRDKAERYKGTPITPFSLTKQLDIGIAYFEHHSNNIDWIEILENALKFDPYDRTKYDCMVSFLMLLSILQEPTKMQTSRKSPIIKIYQN